MSKLALVAALFAVGGCSFGARGYRAARSAECSTSAAPPAIDTAIAVAGAATWGYAMTQDPGEPGSSDGTRSALLGTGALAAIVFTTAAISGYTWRAECRAPSVPATASLE